MQLVTAHDAIDDIVLPPSSGRLFGTSDAGACGGIVINEAAASTLFDGHPVGRVIDAPNGMPVQVIGVVRQNESDGSDAAGGVPASPGRSVPLGRRRRGDLHAPRLAPISRAA